MPDKASERPHIARLIKDNVVPFDPDLLWCRFVLTSEDKDVAVPKKHFLNALIRPKQDQRRRLRCGRLALCQADTFTYAITVYRYINGQFPPEIEQREDLVFEREQDAAELSLTASASQLVSASGILKANDYMLGRPIVTESR